METIMADNVDSDRPRGILTTTDRGYLRGDPKHTPDSRQGKHNRNRLIRERVANGIVDISLLLHELPQEERVRIFDDNKWEHETLSPKESIPNTIAFLFLATTQSPDDWRRCNDEFYSPGFHTALESGLETAYNRHGLHLEALGITPKSMFLQEGLRRVREELGSKESAMNSEVRRLVEGTVVSESELTEFYLKKIDEYLDEAGQSP